MKVYLTEMDGVEIYRISGTLMGDDALEFIRSLERKARSHKGYCIIDFKDVDGIDRSVLEIFRNWSVEGSKLLFSDLDEDLVMVFSFLEKENRYSIFPDWRAAFGHLMTQRGKMGDPAAVGLVVNS